MWTSIRETGAENKVCLENVVVPFRNWRNYCFEWRCTFVDCSVDYSHKLALHCTRILGPLCCLSMFL